ncbi:MAG: ABC transporter substrate-binding protein [Actinomycetota bacterium]|jgi:branched-chain amino acid transport system substrate-binding protein
MKARLRGCTVRLTAVAAALLLVGTACGNRSSDAEIRALFNGAGGTGQAAAPAPGEAEDSAAPAPTDDSGAGVIDSSGGDTSAAGAAGAGGASSAGSGAASSGGGTAAGASRSAASSGAGGASSARGKAAGTPGAGGGAAGAGPSPAGGRQAAIAAPGAKGPGPVPAPGGSGGCTGSEPPIIIGTVGTTSGVLGDVYGSGFKTLKAWVAAINAAGGINCHPVKHLLADDGADPARHQALVRQFVEQEKVIALVWQAAALSAGASKDYEIQNKVPVISQDGGMFYFYDTPVHFPVGANGDVLQRVTVEAGAQIAIPQGKKKAAVITCQEIEYCSVADKIFPDQAKQSGFDVVYQAKATLTQPDYTSQCLSARNAGAEVFLTAFDGATDQRIMASCIKLGYRPILVASSNQQSQDWLTDPNMEGAVVGSSFLPWFLSENPAIAEYQAAVKKYSPGSPFEASGIGAWAAAKTFEHIARVIGKDDVPTKDKIFEGAYALNGDDLGGIVYPMRFSTELPRKKVGCGWAVALVKGKSTSNGKMFCLKGMEP